MFDPSNPDDVLADLGAVFPAALLRATDAARDDLREFRTLRPGWALGMFQREVAGFIHSRIWANLSESLSGEAGLSLRTQEPHREVTLASGPGRTYTFRVKRHSEEDRIRSYPTPTDLEFWGGADITFDGMEKVHLAAGYRWQADTGEIGPAVISYREGKENIVWAMEIEGQAGAGVLPFSYKPIQPSLPDVDLAVAQFEQEQERWLG